MPSRAPQYACEGFLERKTSTSASGVSANRTPVPHPRDSILFWSPQARYRQYMQPNPIIYITTATMNTAKGLRAFHRTFQQAFRSHHAPFRISTEPSTARAFSAPAFRRHHPSTHSPLHRSQSTNAESHQRPLTDRSALSPSPSSPTAAAEPPPTDPSNDSPLSPADTLALRKSLSPAYQLHFTCKKCLHRSTHTVSKQAYHFGSCVVECPGCKARHLVSDHLGIFADTNTTLEDIAREHGEKLRKGRLGAEGDVEFYEEAEGVVEEGGERKEGKDGRGEGLG